MTRARAPGKVVISGAYAVLRGAPSLVSAVDRYAIADSSAVATRVTAEVQAAIDLRYVSHAPEFDSSAQREHDRKLGLGSSAAILVASLLAMNPEATREQLFAQGLLAHRRAQGGGSGVDVAASAYGGTLHYRLENRDAPLVEPVTLPRGVVVEVWSSPVEANTRDLIRAVEAARQRAPEQHEAIFAALFEACEATLAATRTDDAGGFIEGLRAQCKGFSRLGALAGVSIVTDSVRALGERAARDGGVVIPAGAGGGDVCLFVGPASPSAELVGMLPGVGHTRLRARLHAPGASVE